MNIVFITEAYLPITNGVVHVIQLTSEELVRRGHHVRIIAPSPVGVHPKSRIVHYVPSVPFPGGSGYQLAFPVFSTANKLIEQADIVHTHHPFTMGSWAQSVAHNNKKPFLFTNHTQYLRYTHHLPVAGSLITRPLSSYLTTFANNCTVVIAPAAQTAAALQESGVTRPIQVIPNGIEIERFAAGNSLRWRATLNIPQQATILLFTGRLAEEKNIDFLIRAVAELDEQIHLVIVGGGPDQDQLKALTTTLNIAHKVHFLGEISYRLMPDVYAGADIFVTASKTEVHPLTLLEAQAAGLPAVVVQAPGTAEIVQDEITGLVTKPTQTAFVAALRQLILRPALAVQLGKAARKYASNYSVATSVDRLIDTYQLAKRLVAVGEQ
jgi:glycosyltransferase involved in cell wall biosynthesis